MSLPESEFGKLRAFFWPIHRYEVKKVLPMMLMLFLICFNYSILRNIKDAVVVTAKSSGAEVIPFIKVWVLLPMAVFFTLLFTKLSNRYSQERVFYITISFFLLFFALFTYVLYPLRDSLHPHQLSDYLETVLPAGFKGLIAMFRNWSFTLFYAVCEIWGSLVLGVLFWGFANEVTKMTEARRFYSMLGVIASSAAIIAGFIANLLTNDQSWEQTLNVLVFAVIVSGCITMAAFRWMNKNVLSGPDFEEFHEAKRIQRTKKRLSIRESFAYLSNSKYLICIAILVVSYNLVINLVEIVWKDQLRQLYSSALEYNRYMNTMTSAVGIIATLTSLFMSQLIARFGWTRTALITPVIMLVTSAGFFAFMLFRHDLAEPVMLLTGTTPLAIAVFFGAAQVCMSKACKYSVFDSTKEMAFIPLGHECKLKGKAAIDGVGSRLGKSGGSLIHQSLLMVFATVSSSAPYVAIVLFGVIGVWIVAVRSLGKQFAAIIGEQAREDIGEASVAPEVAKAS
ncbi:ADP/ATP translocase [Candidatus Protochlamydia naegleriophila]|uniref:ADP,ATP carrier protein n=1 Tax=Candidatus Protochlamydia naegleriophila TaxID=389348 RepID=A0A0U5J808_9BACT|nr:NTP/NDP exchange transporter [Candidatus Protochlamydia naegleriophila]CUI15896.1 ADP/ATP translocase [Candidatus Protochlamydia naegleriophila]